MTASLTGNSRIPRSVSATMTGLWSPDSLVVSRPAPYSPGPPSRFKSGVRPLWWLFNRRLWRRTRFSRCSTAASALAYASAASPRASSIRPLLSRIEQSVRNWLRSFSSRMWPEMSGADVLLEGITQLFRDVGLVSFARIDVLAGELDVHLAAFAVFLTQVGGGAVCASACGARQHRENFKQFSSLKRWKHGQTFLSTRRSDGYRHVNSSARDVHDGLRRNDRGVGRAATGPPLRNQADRLTRSAMRFSRRRWTEEGMRIASRYLATVRRAMSMPSPFSFSTILSSDRTSAGASASISCLMRWRTASEECASPSPADCDRGGEEILELEDAARRRHVLVRGDAGDRRFVHRDRIGDGLQVERPQVLDAMGEEPVLLAHDLLGHAQDGAGALVEALHQPVGGLQALEQVALVLVGARRLGHERIVAAIDQHARQGVAVELDDASCRRTRRARERRAPRSAPARCRTAGRAWD